MDLLSRQKGGQPRKLLCFSAAFFLSALTVSLLFGRMDRAGAMLLSSAILCAVGAVGVMLLRKLPSWYLPLLAGLMAGLAWCWGYTYLVYRPAEALAGEAGTVRAELTDYAQGRTTYGFAYGILTQVDGKPCRQKVRIYLKDGSPEYAPGDVLVFKGTVRLSNTSSRFQYLQRGTFLTVRQEDWEEVQPGGAMTPLRQCRVLSHRLAERIGELLPGDEGALLTALLTGDRSGLSRDTDRRMTTSGVRHITAVSGLHVSILAGMFLWLFGKKHGLRIVLPFALIYAAIVGFPSSVVRATVLLFFWSASFFWREEKDPLTAWGAALLILTAWNPFSVLSAGLLLSFSATLGLILLAEPISKVLHRPFRKLPRGVLSSIAHYAATSVAASVAAIAFTLPLEMLFFESVPLAGVLTNLLILWAVALAMELGIGALLLSAISLTAGRFAAAWIVRWPLWWILKVSGWIGGWRFAAVDSANLFAAAFGVLLLLGLLLWKGKYLSGKLLLFSAALAFCLAVGASSAERAWLGEVRVIASGGQPAIVLRGGSVSVINTGVYGRDIVEEVETDLTRWNAGEVDTVLCTARDYRASGGLEQLAETLEIQRIILPVKEYSFSDASKIGSLFTYSGSGSLSMNGLEVSLLSAGENVYAALLTGKRFSLLDLCGLKAEQVTAALERMGDGPVQYLLVDDALMSDAALLGAVAGRLSPQKILIANGGYRAYPSEYRSIPVETLDYDGVTLRYVR